ncbi:hypothetical protein Tco_0926659 [Tanacetum coccineum]|uniref:Uncharacterized protein n=1 Tax=Tanacetum coccineum TaxID=301880 RepID=A0ABQ5DAG2_9ASTR
MDELRVEINHLQEMMSLINSNHNPSIVPYDLKGSDEGDNKIDSLTMDPSDTFLIGDKSEMTLVCDDLECDMPVSIPLPTTDVREEEFDINSPLGEYVVDFLMKNKDVAGLPRYLEFEDISSLEPTELTPVIDETSLLVTPLLDPKQICSREVERFDPFFSLTQSVGKTRVIETPSFGFHHRPSPRPAAYSPREVMTPYDLEDLRACFQSSNHADSDHLHVLWIENKAKTEVVRIATDQPHSLDFMEQIIVMRENDKTDSFSEADFKYLNKNDIEDLYYLCRNKKVNYRETKLMNSLITFTKIRVIWERVHDFQLGIKSYQVKVNLIVPTFTFPGIEAYEPYSIVDKPYTSLIYLNSKDEKQVMYLVEIMKFCDATLEKVLKEVKLKIFQSEPWKKPPLLGELDRDIMRAFEREITKRLSHQEQMRRWESFVNGRPILPTMKRL